MTLLLAEAGFAFTLVLVIVLAVIAAVIGAFGLAIKVIVTIIKAIFGKPRNAIRYREAGYAARTGKQICGNPNCREENAAEAVYCRRCGLRLCGRKSARKP